MEGVSGEKVKQFISYLKGLGNQMTQSQFMASIGYKNPSSATQILGKGEVSDKVMKALIKRYPIFLEWIDDKNHNYSEIETKTLMVAEPKHEYGISDTQIIQDLRYTIDVQKELILSKDKINEDIVAHLHWAKEKIEKLKLLLEHHEGLAKEEHIDANRVDWVLESIAKAENIYSSN